MRPHTRPFDVRVVLVGIAAIGMATTVRSAWARSDDRTVAIEVVRTHATSCANCTFFAVESKSPLLPHHRFWVVSTLDRVPSPLWTVAIGNNSKPLVLGSQDLRAWNEMIREERLLLRTDVQAVNYAKAFLDLAVARALFLERLDDRESARLRKKVGSQASSSTRIVRVQGKIRIQCFAKDFNGALQWWDLTLESGGHLTKAVAVPF